MVKDALPGHESSGAVDSDWFARYGLRRDGVGESIVEFRNRIVPSLARASRFGFLTMTVFLLFVGSVGADPVAAIHPCPYEVVDPDLRPLMEFIHNFGTSVQLLGGAIIGLGMIISGVFYAWPDPNTNPIAMRIFKGALIGGLIVLLAPFFASWMIGQFPGICVG